MHPHGRGSFQCGSDRSNHHSDIKGLAYSTTRRSLQDFFPSTVAGHATPTVPFRAMLTGFQDYTVRSSVVRWRWCDGKV